MQAAPAGPGPPRSDTRRCDGAMHAAGQSDEET
jgi:hypothetical protein